MQTNPATLAVIQLSEAVHSRSRCSQYSKATFKTLVALRPLKYVAAVSFGTLAQETTPGTHTTAHDLELKVQHRGDELHRTRDAETNKI